MSLLVDPSTLASFSQVDYTSYHPSLLAATCQVAHDLCAAYLDFDPAIGQHTEEGEVRLVRTGRDAYQIAFRLRHHPLASTAASDVFASLQLLFPAPFPTTDLLAAAGPMGTIVIRQFTGQVQCPYLGAGGLPLIYFSYATPNAPGPTGYRATYTAGYAITLQDTQAHPTALHCPARLRQAAAWVVEALIAKSSAAGQDINAALSGELQSFTNLDYRETYQRDMRSAEGPAVGRSLLHGTQQGRWAMEALDSAKRTALQKVMLL